LIADHLERAGRTEQAADYLSEAGDKARGLYAHQEAIRAYQRALAILKKRGKHERAARMLMKLGLTYHTAFDFRRSRQAYQEGFTLWRQTEETELADLPPAPHPLRVAWRDPLTLDPAMSTHTESGSLIAQLFSGLVEVSPQMDVVPDVARSWELSEGGRTYVFHLRHDARWSDGTPVQAGDFEYAWKRLLDPVTASPNANLLYGIKGGRAFHEGRAGRQDVGVRALDEYTLEVRLEKPSSYFLHLLAFEVMYAVPPHVIEARGPDWATAKSIVTNGPFTLAAWRPDETMVMARNPEYHGRRGGNLQQVELRLLKEWSAVSEMYEADVLEILNLWELPPLALEPARERHAGEYVSGPWATTLFKVFDVSRPPFDDLRLRRALVLATDRETLAHVVLKGHQFAATGGLVPPGMPGHSRGIALPFDPQKAQQLLAQAGYPGGHGFPEVESVSPPAAVSHEVNQYLQAQWRENLGITITTEVVERLRNYYERLDERSPHMIGSGWQADYLDPDSFLRVGLRYCTRWRSDGYDKLVEEAGRVTDQGERMRLYGEADRVLIEEAAIMPLAYGRTHLLVKPWVKTIPTSATGRWYWKDVILGPH
jgi:oligopeptide transport system substrate-binding protein